MDLAIENLFTHTDKSAEAIAGLEDTVDVYEDHLGSYLVRLSGKELSSTDKRTASKILHSIGNFERISDHALNLVSSAQEMLEKKIVMSDGAVAELKNLGDAVKEIIALATNAYASMDTSLAQKVEPLEQVIDLLTQDVRLHHVDRLQSGDCTIENGFVLADILNNYERISDHCSNIAVAVLEADLDLFDPHEYLRSVKSMENPAFKTLFTQYQEKYRFEVQPEHA